MKIITNSGKAFSVSINKVPSKISGFFGSIIKKAVSWAKDTVMVAVDYLHKKLSEIENYILIKLDNLGKYAHDKLAEKFVVIPQIVVDVVEDVIEDITEEIIE